MEAQRKEESVESRILSLILNHSNYFSTPHQETLERQEARVREFVQEYKPVHLVLPAFPAKSPNRRKTLGHLPDMGEVVSLRLLNQLCEDIESIYLPGAKITICSDGRVFSDLVSVSDEKVDEYSLGISEILSYEGLTHLNQFSLEDVFPKHTYQRMREELVRHHAETVESIASKVRTLPSENKLFNGIHRFLFEDRLALFPHLSKNQIRTESKSLAYQVIQRSHAWSRLVEREFPLSIRLSIHPQTPSSPKVGIRLIPSRNLWGTPWHGVAVFDGEKYILMKRWEAESLSATPILAEGKYPCLALRGQTL